MNVWEDIQQIKTLDSIPCFCVLTLHACLWKKKPRIFYNESNEVLLYSPPPPKKNVWQLNLFFKKNDFIGLEKSNLKSIWDKGREHNSFVSTLSLNIDSSLI